MELHARAFARAEAPLLAILCGLRLILFPLLKSFIAFAYRNSLVLRFNRLFNASQVFFIFVKLFFLPLTDTQSGLFTNILSITEAELPRTHEGLSVVGIR